MKRFSQNVKSNESLKLSNEKQKQRLSESGVKSSMKPSLHPWYYVKGRKDLTEKNISSKREKEEQIHKQSVNTNKYFNKCLAETQLFDKWTDQKSLVKHSKQLTSFGPPYDVMIETKPKALSFKSKEIEKKYIKSKEKLTQFMVKFKQNNNKYNELEKRQNVLIFMLNELKNIKTFVEQKKEFCELKTKRLLYLRFSGIKLRQNVFQIIDRLNYYKIAIQNIQRLNASNEALNEEEMTHMSQVIVRAIQILDLYSKLNQNRNNEFQTMFDEELDLRWDTQLKEWQQEYQVWEVMVDKVIDSYKNVLKEKLRQILNQQNISLDERKQFLKELNAFVTQIKSEPHLNLILTQNINELTTDSSMS